MLKHCDATSPRRVSFRARAVRHSTFNFLNCFEWKSESTQGVLSLLREISVATACPASLPEWAGPRTCCLPEMLPYGYSTVAVRKNTRFVLVAARDAGSWGAESAAAPPTGEAKHCLIVVGCARMCVIPHFIFELFRVREYTAFFLHFSG